MPSENFLGMILFNKFSVLGNLSMKRLLFSGDMERKTMGMLGIP
jgi:hypothetical protein